MDNTYQKNIGGYKIEVTSKEILKYGHMLNLKMENSL